MVIYHFTTNLSGGGAETQLRILAENLPINGLKQRVVFKFAANGFPFDKYKTIDFIKIADFDFSKLEKSRVILHIWIPDVFTYISPFSFYRHRDFVLIGIRNRYSFNSLKRVYQFFCFTLFKHFVSNVPLELHRRHYKFLFQNKYEFIPNALKYPINNTSKTFSGARFLFVGRLVPQKGVIDLIKTFSLLKEFDFEVTIVGEGQLFHEARNLIKNAGLNERIFLEGYKNDVLEYYNLSDFFILPSYNEGMPNVAFEAASQNCILILSDLAENRYWFSEEEVFFFKPGNIYSLRDVILSSLSISNEQRSTMIYNSKKILKKLSLESYLVSYMSLYDNIRIEND
ncbi:glycosyltransferase [Algoriphagus sp. PAP.12]|uniref:glycosyltransferase n=1 Tax=Algoriphagus sp. PAP.12 TaxID=2996678 RepID=UPI00227AD037|nr:glycosyltransferase [Algoriphagus sp. PAP.12]